MINIMIRRMGNKTSSEKPFDGESNGIAESLPPTTLRRSKRCVETIQIMNKGTETSKGNNSNLSK